MAARLRKNDALRALIVIGGLPNIILLPTAVWGSRALINLEYLVIAAFERYMSRAMLGVLLAITLTLDVLITFAPIFNFGPPEIVDAVQQMAHFRGRAILAAIGIMLFIMALAAAVVRLRGKPKAIPSGGSQMLRLCATVGLSAVVVDAGNGSSSLWWRATMTVDMDVATSLLASDYMRGWRSNPKHGQPMEAATDELRLALVGATADNWSAPRKVVLVIMESMGLPRGVSQEQIWAPFMTEAIGKRYDVRTGEVPFLGATTAGEFREMCGIRMTHLTVRGATLPPCLPNQLQSLGYETFGMHGYNGMLFQRLEWYPRVGFERMEFDDDISKRPNIARCGRLFHGVCDSTALSLVREELTRDPERKQFVYWLTLTSHFPLGSAEFGSEGCNAVGDAGEIPLVCQLWTALWPALTGLAEMAGDTTVPPAWYIIVGDHMPPQLLSAGDTHPSDPPRDRQLPSRFGEDRLAFSTSRVPFIELRPRSR
ncbi:MAG: sulfatase-like hydrolase/transferase [Gemmatimonadaceae bacterium]